MTAQLDEIPFVDVNVKMDSLEADLFQIIQTLFPGARREDWLFEELQGGYVNSILKLTDLRSPAEKKRSLVFRTFDVKFDATALTNMYSKKEETTNGHGKETNRLNGDSKKEDMNGDTKEKSMNGKIPNGEDGKTEKAYSIFDRQTEYFIMNEISKYGLCQPVYARYQNGICYGYTVGNTIDGELMLSDEYLEEAASKFAKFHSIKYEHLGLPLTPRFDRFGEEKRENYFENLKKTCEPLASVTEGPYLEMPKLEVLIEYQKRIYNAFKKIGLGRICFNHNDLNKFNVIWNSQAAPGNRFAGFIDLEMAMANYAVIDLGYHFGCFPGHLMVDIDEKFFPSSDYRRRFLKRYLQEFNKIQQIKLTDEEFTAELEDLFHRVSLASALHILRWCVFSFLFDINEDLLKNAQSIAARKADKHFCAKYALSAYKLFSKLYPQVLEEAEQHFANKQAQTK